MLFAGGDIGLKQATFIAISKPTKETAQAARERMTHGH